MKRMIKRILSVLLVAVMLLTAAPLSGFVGLDIDFRWLDFSTKSSALSSSGYCGSNVTYTFDSGTGMLTISGTGDMWDYHFDYPLSPFYKNSSIKSVVINNGITSIGIYAFYGCTGLTSMTIPDSVTSIGRSAFIGCTSLTSITIPDSVTSIGSSAFESCTSLTSITVGSNNTEYDSRENCNAIIETETNTLIQGCKNTTIPDSVKSIGYRAFASCTGLTSITIPNGVTSIGDYAFYGCTGLTSITVDSNNTEYDSRENCNAIIETETNTLIQGCKNTIIPNSVTSIDSRAFENCTGLTSITIPDSVTSIGRSAFSGCRGLTSITIPDSVTYIGRSVFSDCTGLTSITIPDSVTSIDRYAFCACTGLTSITIPDSVRGIGRYAFESCTSLTSITIPDSVTSIGYGAFYRCTGLKSITVDSNNTVYDSRENCNAIIETKTNTLVQGCEYTIIPNSVTSIGGSAFYYCTGLTSITIPDSVTSIGGSAFYGCTGLTSITIPDSVTSIGEYAFYNTGYYNNSNNWENNVLYIGNHLIDTNHEISNSYTIKSGTITIADGAFNDCSGLTSITIPDSVTSIGYRTFYGCTGLTSITIPDSVTSIGESAFESCTSLTSATIGNSVTSIGSLAFEGCTNLTSIEIPDSVTSLGSYALIGCTNLISIEIGNGVTEINESDFENLTSLKSVTIGTGVTTIGDYAFNGCTGLEEMVIPYSVNSIGTAAFAGCTSLDSLTVYSRNCTFADDSTAYYTTIYGFTGSTAETYANEKGFDFVAIDDTHEHVYDNVCDSICNLCGNESSLRGHTYYSNCDADCNICGALRVPPHTDKGNDGVCDNCGEYLSDIALSTVKNVAVSAGETVYLKFTAPYTGRYTFYSSSSSDTYGYVCNSEKNALARDDDSGSNHNFSITTTLTKGTVYYLGLKYYNSSNSGTIPVTIDYICDHTVTHTEHIDSTCNEHGYDKVICDICGVTVTTTELPYKHEYVATVTNPTCTEQGYTTYTCECGDSYVADYVDALGHDFGEWKVTTPATCTSTGVETRYCSRCDATETRDIEKISHSYSAVVTSPTCTEQGYTTYTCECGDNYVDDYVDALGHDYKAVVTAPTCTEQGFTTYTCSRCKDSYIADYTPAKGHTDGEWKVTKQPTLTEEGEKTLYCKECGQVIKTEAIPKITHGQVHSVSVNDIALNYKSSKTLAPTVEVDEGVSYTVTYSSSNPKVATVDENGKVTATKKGSGSATITCTVTDEYGNTVTDTCTVKVSLNFGQILLVYVLFGWIWY